MKHARRSVESFMIFGVDLLCQKMTEKSKFSNFRWFFSVPWFFLATWVHSYPLNFNKTIAWIKRDFPKKIWGRLEHFCTRYEFLKISFFFKELLFWLLLTTSSILNLLPLTQNMTQDLTLMWTISGINFVKIWWHLIPQKYPQSGQKCPEYCNYDV